MVVAQVALGFRQHAAGAAGRVQQGAHHAGLGEQFIVVDEQQAHHQADDFAGGEMVAGGFVRELVEAADQVLEDQAHLLVRHPVRVQIHIAELGDDQIEDVGLPQLLNFGSEVEMLHEDALHIGRESLNVAGQMRGDVVRVPLQLLEIQRGAVVKALAGGVVQHHFQGVALQLAALAPLAFRQHLRLGGCQHAIEAAQHRHGQHHPLILRRAVRAAQQVSDLPDQVGEVAMVTHWSIWKETELARQNRAQYPLGGALGQIAGWWMSLPGKLRAGALAMPSWSWPFKERTAAGGPGVGSRNPWRRCGAAGSAPVRSFAPRFRPRSPKAGRFEQ